MTHKKVADYLADNLNLVLKVVIASAVISLFIKYVLPAAQIPAHGAIALFMVILPTVVLASILGWKALQH